MRLPRLFVLLFSLSFGFTLATTITGSSFLMGTPLEEFVPPQSAYNYQPPSTTNPFDAGDIIWGFTQIFVWMSKTPGMLASLVRSVGVPEPWATAIIYVGYMAFAAYIIYLIAGRIVSAR